MTNEELKEIYFKDLEKITQRGTKMVSRVRHPQNWRRIKETSPESRLLLESYNNVWIWSDLHFGHANVIGFSNRPFANVEEMDKQLVANFNDCVGHNDVSIWCGDVGFKATERTNTLLDRCNGYKILVVGNHDLNHGKLRQLNFNEQYVVYSVETPDVDLVLTHYPIEVGLPKPYINVHGHVHDGTYKFETDQHINVCCEFHNYRPLELTTVIQWAKSRVVSFDKEK